MSPGTASSHGTCVSRLRRGRARAGVTWSARLGGTLLPGGVHRLEDVVDRALSGQQPDLVLRQRARDAAVPPFGTRVDHVLLLREELGEARQLVRQLALEELVLGEPAGGLREELVLLRAREEVDEGLCGRLFA